MATVLEAADAIKRLKMYPYFDVAHYILNCMAVREDTYHQPPTGTTLSQSRLYNRACKMRSISAELYLSIVSGICAISFTEIVRQTAA